MKSFPILMTLALAACSTPFPPPRLTSVEPARVSTFLATPISIRGEAIEYAVNADLDSPARSTFALDLHVRLIGPETVELVQAARVSSKEVTANVPATLRLGRYTVEVSTARGVARLVDALEISSCFLDCEGTSDGGCFSWVDADKDSYGAQGSGAAVCADDAGVRVGRGGDCRDFDPLARPDAFEVCNGLDDDCDGVVDDGTCAGDAGWKVRTDTGGDGEDWETATNSGRGRVWLAEKQRVYLRAGSGAFTEVPGCSNKVTASWASPSGVAYFGGTGVAFSALPGGCSSALNVSGTVAGLQGFGGRIFGALTNGTLGEWVPGAFVERAGLGGGAAVRDVQGASPASLFAVGSANNRPKVWRLATDGGTFVDENVQSLAVPDQTLTAIWAVDDALAYAVGSQGALLERDDSGWRVLPAADGGLSAVRAFGRGRVYAATTDGRVLRFDGVRWETRYRHPGGGAFTDITASAEDDLWVVGYDGLVVHFPE